MTRALKRKARVRIAVRLAFRAHICGLVPWRALVWMEQAFLPLLYGSSDLLLLARVVAARSAVDVETSWSQPIPEVVQGRAGRHFLPIVVAPAQRVTVGTRWSALFARRGPRRDRQRMGKPTSSGKTLSAGP
jgi:hypothetical protein